MKSNAITSSFFLMPEIGDARYVLMIAMLLILSLLEGLILGEFHDRLKNGRTSGLVVSSVGWSGLFLA